jgi:hypothetical protein
MLEGSKCEWCRKEEMCVTLENSKKEPFDVCIPCLGDVRQGWLAGRAFKNKLTRIK